MTSKHPRIDLQRLKTMSISDRKSKVNVEQFAAPHRAGASVGQFLDHLPDILAGRSVREVIEAIADAHTHRKPVVAAMGAHVIKCGLSPIIVDLLRRRLITAIALNGAGAIHDAEIALFGETSEDVVDTMRTGMFGMARETADFLNDAAQTAQNQDLGFGEALGKALVEANATHRRVSLLAAAYESDIPATVHVSIGSDIVHMHPTADGAAIGAASMTDFRILTQAMTGIHEGGVLMNIGSAVVLPEVILKALNTIVNLGQDVGGMIGVNLDFIQHYRSNQQVVSRVRELGGAGISLTGHHELMIPLIAAGVIERLGNKELRAADRKYSPESE